MESYSEKNTNVILQTLSNDDQVPNHESNENTNSSRQSTPTHVIQGFDGEFVRVRTRDLKLRWMTKPCLTFCLHSLVLTITIVVGLVMMILMGFSDPSFQIWYGLFTLGIGGFLPGPKLSFK